MVWNHRELLGKKLRTCLGSTWEPWLRDGAVVVSPEPPPRPEQTGCEAHQVRRPTRSHLTQGSGQLTPCCGHPAPAHPPAPAPTAGPACPLSPSPAGVRGVLEHVGFVLRISIQGLQGKHPREFGRNPARALELDVGGSNCRPVTNNCCFLCSAGTTVPVTGWVPRRSKQVKDAKG